MSVRSVLHRLLRCSSQLALSILISLLALEPALANGPPAQIILHVVGDAQDQTHAMYKPGSSLKLQAEVLDANGQPADTSNSPCTPVYDIADNITPDGKLRGSIVGDHVVFGQGLGNFSVNAHCAENPNISTASSQAPYNFQTSTSAFAKTGGEDFVKSLPNGGALASTSQTSGAAEGSGATGAGGGAAAGGGGSSALAAVALVGGIAVGVAAIALAASSSSGGGCSSGTHQCPPPYDKVCCPDANTIYCPSTNTCTNMTLSNFGDYCGNGSTAIGC